MYSWMHSIYFIVCGENQTWPWEGSSIVCSKEEQLQGLTSTLRPLYKLIYYKL